jgi:hypothetical protein
MPLRRKQGEKPSRFSRFKDRIVIPERSAGWTAKHRTNDGAVLSHMTHADIQSFERLTPMHRPNKPENRHDRVIREHP